ncbi:hypothetical protein SSBG_05325 [Streptomyces sp. SPB074]|nr:hypothetical protein SSBG_05325 [Streptomyces sp. SPB074]
MTGRNLLLGHGLIAGDGRGRSDGCAGVGFDERRAYRQVDDYDQPHVSL